VRNLNMELKSKRRYSRALAHEPVWHCSVNLHKGLSISLQLAISIPPSSSNRLN
jgi:hypothetical protein